MPQYYGHINSKYCAVHAVLNRHINVTMGYNGKEDTLKWFMIQLHFVFIIHMTFFLGKKPCLCMATLTEVFYVFFSSVVRQMPG